MSLVSRVLPAESVPSLAAWEAGGGGRAFDNALQVEPLALIDEVEAAGLRGRGGAGFPTGVKWRTVAANRAPVPDQLPTTVVVNGAEGEPGTYKDRAILCANPYVVLEGALIAALAVGAGDIVVALKEDEPEAYRRVDAAIAEMGATGWLDDCPVAIITGPRHYLFGEETALLEVVDGRPPFPRIAPPYRRGVIEVVEEDADVDRHASWSAHVEMAGPGPETLAPPALVDNVETLANVVGIIAEGGDWFRTVGTERSPGTIVCTVTGAVVHPGVGEIALGTTVREAIDLIGGGEDAERPVKAVLCGVSAAPLTPDRLDTPLTYEDMAAAGSGLGTASLIVIGADTDMTAVAAGAARFLAVESCGQCTPCKVDGLRISDAIERLCRWGTGDAPDLDALAKALTTVADGARCNLASQQQAVVGAIFDTWGHEFAARAAGATPPVEPYLIAEVIELGDDEVRVDIRHRDKQPDWSFDDEWSGSFPADVR